MIVVHHQSCFHFSFLYPYIRTEGIGAHLLAIQLIATDKVREVFLPCHLGRESDGIASQLTPIEYDGLVLESFRTAELTEEEFDDLDAEEEPFEVVYTSDEAPAEEAEATVEEVEAVEAPVEE